ncbi:hypothetical protein Cfor_01327 [Coptotermes formosanus]|uniref:Uncharacterized protein n=1 Tax=Coptotermes formosanus TaxID=36987 RepID=A0A6L2PS06_COPFO|nr:hypothetical protein Cfor_01327 [Coptotermes formosanus]
MKTVTLEACKQLLTRYESKGNDFPYSIFTADEIWVYHYDLELRSQSLGYHHSTSPRKKKFRTQPSAGSCMLTVFWDYRCLTWQEYMIKGKKINSMNYVKTLKWL